MELDCFVRCTECTLKCEKPLVIPAECEAAGETGITCPVSLTVFHLYCVAIDFAEMQEP